MDETRKHCTRCNDWFGTEQECIDHEAECNHKQKVGVVEVGVDENNNPTLSFEYRGKNYMGVCSEEN